MSRRVETVAKHSMEALNGFIKSLVQSERSVRVQFVRWLMPVYEANRGITLMPMNLHSAIVEPTLNDWPEEPGTSIDHLLWLGRDMSMGLAVQKQPRNEKAIARYFSRITCRIRMNQHETDNYAYDGDPGQDKNLLGHLKDVCAQSIRKLDYEKEIALLTEIAEEWVQRRKKRNNNAGNTGYTPMPADRQARRA